MLWIGEDEIKITFTLNKIFQGYLKYKGSDNENGTGYGNGTK